MGIGEHVVESAESATSSRWGSQEASDEYVGHTKRSGPSRDRGLACLQEKDLHRAWRVESVA